jgi:hypothetical protein
MGKSESSDIILGILYASAAVFLFVASYMIYIKRFRRNKLVAIDEVVFSTSRYDEYSAKTQFLIVLATANHVKVKLMNAKEEDLAVLIEADMPAGENVMDFDPTLFENGVYYLSLITEGTTILRRIKITV